MNTHLLIAIAAFAGASYPQQPNDIWFPSDHATVDGSTFETRIPFSGSATMHSMLIYEAVDLAIPGGHQITHVGFRRDGTVVSLGATVELQIFMGTTTATAATAGNNYANNYAGSPTEVFTRKMFTLPDLGNPLNPNPNGDLVLVPLDTAFPYTAGSNLVVEYKVYSNSRNASFVYQLDKGTFRSATNAIGQGCNTSANRLPTLTGAATSCPGTMTLTYSNGLANAVCVLFFSLQQTPANPILSLFGAPGCDLFVNFQLGIGQTMLTNASGRITSSTTVPDNAALNDLHIYSQVLMLDAAANQAGAVVSNAFDVELGMTPRMTTIDTTNVTSATGTVRRNNGIVSLFRHQ